MNEQIEKLAELSGFKQDMLNIGIWYSPEFQKFAERFAELIIVDVINRAERYGLGCDAVEQLKEDFGVRE
jgi:hypothetical protein